METNKQHLQKLIMSAASGIILGLTIYRLILAKNAEETIEENTNIKQE